jgi:hypothetical protein
LYERCDGTLANPCVSNYTFNLTSYGVVQNITNINLYFAGQNDGASSGRRLNISYWNGTVFNSLSNTLTWGGTATTQPSPYDEFLTNSVPISAIVNGVIKLRLANTAGSYRVFYNWLSLTLMTGGGSIQDLKGSSELHVTSTTGYEFLSTTLCGDYNQNCALFKQDASILDEPQGIIVENITFTNYYTGTSLSSTYRYETALGVDCTAILQIDRYNGGVTDITNDVSLSVGTSENCIIDIPVNFNSTVSSFNIVIIFDNYLKWEVNYYKDLIKFYNKTISDYCVPIGITNGYSYDVPITVNLTNSNLELIFCHRALDDIYFFNLNYDESLSVANVGDYESYFSEARFYYPLIRNHYADVKQTLILNKTGTNFSIDYDRISNSVWNRSSRNLTYYPSVSATVNTTAIAESVWSWQGDIVSNILDKIGNAIWQFMGAKAEVLT